MNSVPYFCFFFFVPWKKKLVTMKPRTAKVEYIGCDNNDDRDTPQQQQQQQRLNAWATICWQVGTILVHILQLVIIPGLLVVMSPACPL